MTHEDSVGICNYDAGIIVTMTGKAFDVFNPREADVDVYDIAWMLAHKYRFSGACCPAITVAEHSCLVHDLMEIDLERSPDCLVALMHDAAEAYVGDVTRPVKIAIPQFKELENKVWECICRALDLDSSLMGLVKTYDNIAVRAEAHCCMPDGGASWNWNGVDLDDEAVFLVDSHTPEEAYREFLYRYRLYRELA